MHSLAPSFAQSTDRGYSGGLWGDCPVTISDLQNNPTLGWYHDDDFTDFLLPGTQTTEINLGRYKVYNTGAGTVKTDSMPTATGTATRGGIISMLCDTAGDQSVIGTHACPFSLNSGAGKLWFEARIATTSIATNMTHIFIGLGNNADVTFGAAIPLADANATGTAVALVGFNRLEDGLGVLNTAYTDEAATYTNVQASAGAIVAETWIKLGMKFDPNGGSNALSFYVNGVKTTTSLSATALAALTHLDASGLGLVFAQFADSAGTANYAYLDMWRCIQIPVNNVT